MTIQDQAPQEAEDLTNGKELVNSRQHRRWVKRGTSRHTRRSLRQGSLYEFNHPSL